MFKVFAPTIFLCICLFGYRKYDSTCHVSKSQYLSITLIIKNIPYSPNEDIYYLKWSMGRREESIITNEAKN